MGNTTFTDDATLLDRHPSPDGRNYSQCPVLTSTRVEEQTVTYLGADTVQRSRLKNITISTTCQDSNIPHLCACNDTWQGTNYWIETVCNLTGTQEPGTWVPEYNISLQECQKRCTAWDACASINFRRVEDSNVGTCELAPVPPTLPLVYKFNDHQKLPDLFFSGKFAASSFSNTETLANEIWELPRQNVGLGEIEIVSPEAWPRVCTF